MYGLDTSVKEKNAIFITDLHVIIHGHWTLDTRALHGQIQVQMSLILLLYATTATRPGALIVSRSIRGSTRVLLYEHILIMRVHDVKNLK